ncbi:S41 family peptidase [Prosthecobacter sp.]|uniref:S41 family peptidase n=1 Tax=Prosthecobacter sp. TaxID=1965333 RepID=UPI001DC3F8E3|nr:S41 family peptidase [Prosthecobacter sp.]MCB1276521.1 PDZ domain-containing protein [Prosthecobacter sp.]
MAMAVLMETAQVVEKECYYPVTSGEVVTRALGRLYESGVVRGEELPPLPKLSMESVGAVQESARAHLALLTTLPGQRYGALELVDKALALFCGTLDEYSRYESAEDMARIDRLAAIPGTSGIGITVQQKEGDFFCYPYPEGTASAAGVSPGDMLVTIDGKPVSDRTLASVVGQIRGVPGTQVNLRLKKATGRSQMLTVTRDLGGAPPLVKVERDAGGLLVRVRRFDEGVSARLAELLRQQEGSSPQTLTLDLRGNGGGQITEAVGVANVFMDEGALVVTNVERGMAPVQMRTTAKPLVKPFQISILQDEGTASASEVVIAALFAALPDKVSSQGAKTYGKGILQEEIRLKSGGRLTLTVGRMFSPAGLCWDGTGLAPSLSNGGKIYSPKAISMESGVAKPRPVIKLVE